MSAERRPRAVEAFALYRLQLALGAAGLAVCTVVLGAAASTVHVHPAAAHRLAVAGVRLTYPAVNGAAIVLFALAVLGVVVIAVAAQAAGRQLRAHRRLVRGLQVAGPLPGHPTVLVIDVAAPVAFCAGWLRPRVYVSTALLERLSADELRAVLAHEQHHGALRDPLRLAGAFRGSC